MKLLAKIMITTGLIAGVLIAPNQANAATRLAVISFENKSASLNQTAKNKLASIKSKISNSDVVTVTGYLQNHSGNSYSIGLDRAIVIKNYLTSLGVKATIKTVNGGIPKKGGSKSDANGAMVSKVAGGLPTGSYKVTFNLNGKTKLKFGSLPAPQTATKSKPNIFKPYVTIGSGESYLCTSVDWTVADWSLTPNGKPITWKLIPGVGYSYTPTKNTTLYAIWKLQPCFWYGDFGSANMYGQPADKYRIYTGDSYTGLITESTYGDFSKFQKSMNYNLNPIVNAPVKANIKFVFPDHGSGQANDYTFAINSVPFDFSGVPGSFVHDATNGLNIYYYWYQPSSSVKSNLVVTDNLLAD